ncbi:hypothetical protein G6F55_014116 [Rhizopus delemar]|nr:hypothetical protein G6F55_014116 [Rhizopus delemar]
MCRNRHRAARAQRQRPGHPDFRGSRRPGPQRPEQRRRVHHRQLPGIRPRLPPTGRAAVADTPQGAETTAFRAGHQARRHHAQVVLEQHHDRHGRGLWRRLRMHHR